MREERIYIHTQTHKVAGEDHLYGEITFSVFACSRFYYMVLKCELVK